MIIKLLIGLTGCAITTKAIVPSEKEPIFKEIKTVKINIIDEVKTDYSRTGIEMFEDLLKQRIGTALPYSEMGAFGEKIYKGLNYKLVNENEDLLINITINYFKPDNKALRWVVGFGAGKGGLRYKATFESGGKVFAVLEGGKSYGDMGSMIWDPDSTLFRGKDSTQILMVTHSVNEIVEFIRSNGQKYRVVPSSDSER